MHAAKPCAVSAVVFVVVTVQSLSATGRRMPRLDCGFLDMVGLGIGGIRSRPQGGSARQGGREAGRQGGRKALARRERPGPPISGTLARFAPVPEG